MTTLLLNRRNLLKLLSMLPFLRKLIEPAPEVVQPILDKRMLLKALQEKGVVKTESKPAYDRIKFFLVCLPPQLVVEKLYVSPLTFMRLSDETRMSSRTRFHDLITVCNVKVFQARPDEMPYMITAAGQRMGIAL